MKDNLIEELIDMIKICDTIILNETKDLEKILFYVNMRNRYIKRLDKLIFKYEFDLIKKKNKEKRNWRINE